MPKDNNQQPTTPPPTTNGDDQPPIFMEETLPPMPQEDNLQNQVEQPIDNKQETQPTETPTPQKDSGSAAPQDDNIIPPIVNTNNKKKFVGGKVIATILGLFLLIGGVGAGIFLVNQNQNINEKAVGCSPEGEYCGGTTTCCTNLTCTDNICISTPTCSHNACMPVGGSCCTGFTGVKDLSCGSQIKCNPSPTNPPSECISDGRCLDPGENCCGNDSYTDNTCTPTTTRCGTKPTPTTVPADECEDAGGTCKRGTTCSTGENKLSLECENSNDICCKPTVDPLCATEVKCTTTGCSVGSFFPTCYINHWVCDKNSNFGGEGCQDKLKESKPVSSASFTESCGTEQIDVYCPACNIGTGQTRKGIDYITKIHPTACTTPTTPPTNPPGTTSCTNIKAYTEDWVLISQTNLSKLKAGDKTNFCVSGTTSSGSFDKARVTINGSLKPETITKRPGTNDFCYLYTIPSGTKTFNITSQIHHKELNQWK